MVGDGGVYLHGLVQTLVSWQGDPGLVERRLTTGPTAEHEQSQKIIQTLTAILWCALTIVPGIERHSILRAFQRRAFFQAMRLSRWVTTLSFSR
jgi:hypothetical protein